MSIPFPDGDVFRPLFANPKQPQTFATLQAVKARDSNTSATVGSVGLGENFGFYSRRQGCNGWQVGLLAGIFSQFDMNAPSTDLINTDYVVVFPCLGVAASSRRVCVSTIRARTWAMSLCSTIPESTG